MADQLQLRGGTTNEHSTFTGALREVTVDTDKDTLIVHDAATAGGHPLLREDGSNSALSLGTAGTPSIKFTGDTNTGLYSPGADQVAISTGGSARLYIAADGDVGIGTTSPSYKLSLVDGGNNFLQFATGGDPVAGALIGRGGDTTLRIQNSENAPINFWTNNTERLRIDSSGRVGIGTSSPSVPLQVRATQAEIKLTSDAGGLSQLQFGDTADEVRGAIVYNATDDKLFINSYNNQTAITVDSSERVGVGTTSPEDLLHIMESSASAAASSGASVAQFERAGNVGITISTADTGESTVFFGDTASSTVGRVQYDHSDNSLGFWANSLERARIDSSGRLGVGTSSPSARLQIEETSPTDGILLYLNNDVNSSGSEAGFRIRHNDTDQLECNVLTERTGLNAGLDFKIELSGSDGTVQERFRVTETGNVGVGTTSPAFSNGDGFEIQRDGTACLRLDDNTNSKAGEIYADSTGLNIDGRGTGAVINFDIGGSTKATLDNSGRLGIGTSSPQQELHINDASGVSRIRLTGGATGADNFEIGQSIPNVSNSGFSIYDVDADANRLVINSSGNVGIGTTSPTARLNVNSGGTDLNADFVGTSSPYIRIDNGTKKYIAQVIGSDFRIQDQSANAERLRIDSSGRLLVGTSTARSNLAKPWVGAFTPNFQIEQGGDTSNTGMALVNNSATGYASTFAFAQSRNSSVGGNGAVVANSALGIMTWQGNDGTNFIRAAQISAEVDGTPGTNDMPGRLVFSTTADSASSPTERMRIDQAGYIMLGGGPTGQNGSLEVRPNNSFGAPTVRWDRNPTSDGSTAAVFANNNNTVGSITYGDSSTSFNTSSDYRLKENVVDLEGAITRVKQLAPKRFNFIVNAEKTVDGFLAHEAQVVVPEAVFGTKDEVDDEGNPVYQGIDQSKLVPLLTAALQEAIAKIEILEAKVAALEAN